MATGEREGQDCEDGAEEDKDQQSEAGTQEICLGQGGA